jgi:predicted RNA-binding protein YlqC (UPF0109 family)
MLEITLNPDDRAISHMMEEIAKALVDVPGEVRVELLDGPDTMTLRLHVADSDVGKLIGKQGRTARSLRTILSAVSMKCKRRYALDIA